MIRLNTAQRVIAIAIGILIVVLQSSAIWTNGLEDSRGWIWAFLASAVLIGAGFSGGATPEQRTIPSVLTDAAAPPPASQAVPSHLNPALGSYFGALAARATALVGANASLANRVHEFAVASRLPQLSTDPNAGPESEMRASAVAHAILVIAFEESAMRPDSITWDAYRQFLEHRLANRRLARLGQLRPEGARAPAAPLRAALRLAGTEIRTWERNAHRALENGLEAGYPMLLRHIAATFGCSDTDGASFRPLVEELLDRARHLVLPLKSDIDLGTS